MDIVVIRVALFGVVGGAVKLPELSLLVDSGEENCECEGEETCKGEDSEFPPNDCDKLLAGGTI